MEETFSAPDPYLLGDPGASYGPPFTWTDGRTPSDPRLVTGQSVAVFIALGQSTIANHNGTPFVPTRDKIDNLCLTSGGLYAAVDPLLGTDGTTGNPLTRFADKLRIAGRFQRIILLPAAVGGTHIAMWQTGGVVNDRIGVAWRRLAAAGFAGLPIYWLWQQGETDNSLNTPQATYTASLNQVIATIRAVSNHPIMVSQTTWAAGAPDTAVRAAQAAAPNPALGIYAGPDTDAFDNSYRIDTTHFNATGSDAVATAWKNAFNAAFPA